MPRDTSLPAYFNPHALYSGSILAKARGECPSHFYEARRNGEVEPPAVDEPRFVRWTGEQIMRNLAERVSKARMRLTEQGTPSERASPVAMQPRRKGRAALTAASTTGDQVKVTAVVS